MATRLDLDVFDLDAYFHRINYTGDQTPSLDTLKTIHRKHAMTFPFENINTLMGWPVPLGIDALQEKMVSGGRGGYCYEQNLLFKSALESIGFRVTGLAARVLSNPNPDRIPPRSHMLLRVEVDNESYIADAGFGGMTLTEPIRLEANTVQETSHERRRLIQDGDEFTMQAQVQDEWRILYRFNLTPNHLSDYEVANWYICTHPDSHFRKRLSVARPTPEGRFALRNNDFASHRLDGGTERTLLTSASEIRDTLEDVFLLKLPKDAKLDEILDRIARSEEE